jgi:carbonic anhydrase/acetyltransferase-like protein (isoleucine patch superfamily)
LRFIGNAAGHLTNELAERLHAAFNCHVLPSYGCTEAMPITSPPPTYNLEKPGSSGMPCGPEVCIIDDAGAKQVAGQIGHIVVRGCPVMQAYEGVKDSDAFTGGWLRTGDVGFLDEHGWLFITGRSKEVINRGGEILSPAEIEEAIAKCVGVKEVAAFSAFHDTLQETVGVILVMDIGARRPDLRTLYSQLSGRLHPSKWPQVIVFMDKLIRGATGKVLRSRIAQRCGLPIITDEMPTWFRFWEASAPEPGVSLNEAIECRRLQVQENEVEDMCMASGLCEIAKVCWAKARGRDMLAVHVKFKEEFTHRQAKSMLEHLEFETKLHDYEIPCLVVPLSSTTDLLGPLPVMQHWRGERYVAPAGELETKIARIWQSNLQPGTVSNCLWLSVDNDFFEVGGSSLLAGAVISQMRSELGVALSAQLIYTHRTVEDMAECCNKLMQDQQRKRAAKAHPNLQKVLQEKSGKSLALSQDFQFLQPSVWSTGVQMLPVLICRPLMTIFRLGVLTTILSWAAIMQATRLPSFARTPLFSIMCLLVCVAITSLIKQIVFPLTLICTKWLLIGTYREGHYPVYGSMYVRWWLFDILMNNVLDVGIFEYDMKLFYRLMGARIGKGAKIAGSAVIAEFDLVTIGAGASVDDFTIVRGFGLSRGGMMFRRVTVGAGSQVGHRSIVAPGHVVPDRSFVHMHSSSYDVAPGSLPKKYANHQKHLPSLFLRLCLGYPLLLSEWVLGNAAVVVLYLLIISSVAGRDFNSWDSILRYLTRPHRLKFFFMIPVARQVLRPLIELVFAVAVKSAILGKFRAGPQVSDWARFRRWMVVKMLRMESGAGHSVIPRVLELFGSHFQATTWIYHFLGMKVGQRIYWPGRGLHVVEFDLIEVQDDVIFGSRSHFICSDDREAQSIRIEAGAMVADRCVVLPGCTIGRNAMLGSGGLGPADTRLPEDSLWVGSQQGRPVELYNSRPRGGPTLRSFGKAFYKREAPYFVWPFFVHAAYCMIWHPIVALNSMIPFVTMLCCTACLKMMQTGEVSASPATAALLSRLPDISHWFPIYAILVQSFLTGAWAAFIMLTEVQLQKWILGRRVPGKYNWDETSFCQRWLLARCVHKIVNEELDLLRGTPMMSAYFRLQGANIGDAVCLYPTGADPYMTEPDLVSIGDGACVDKASLVAHSNTFGEYELRTLEVGHRATLRANSRLISGAKMAENSEMLEHTLVLPGDTVPKGQACQGWPASEYIPLTEVDLPWNRDDVK